MRFSALVETLAWVRSKANFNPGSPADVQAQAKDLIIQLDREQLTMEAVGRSVVEQLTRERDELQLKADEMEDVLYDTLKIISTDDDLHFRALRAIDAYDNAKIF